MAAPDYAALKAEVQNDPLALGYAGKTDVQVADLLNGTDRPATTTRSIVPAYEVWEAMVPAEWAALTAQEKQRVQTIVSMGSVNLQGANTRAALSAAFGPSTATRTALVALQSQTVPRTRAQEIFGQAVASGDVFRARNQT